MPSSASTRPDFSEEEKKQREGFARVVGLDEAGRGPWAGPVVAAAVRLPYPLNNLGLNDSKKLSATARAHCAQCLKTHPEVQWALGTASPKEIDALNILEATWLAMRRALEALPEPADFALVDGPHEGALPLPRRALVKGDQHSLSIAAASILAKVHRDELMIEASQAFPQYGFERHKGYGTALHRSTLQTHGPCPLHRRSFQPVAACARLATDS